MKRLITVALLLTLALVWIVPAAAETRPEIDRALDWLATQQLEDGGFTNGFTAESDLGATVEIVLAAVAVGADPTQWTPSPLAYLETQVTSDIDAGALSRIILATVALSADPHDFAGEDLVAALLDTQDTTTGQFGDSLYAHAYAILALHNAGATVPENALALLREQQLDDGSWAMLSGSEPDSGDSNTTALAVQALVAVGESEIARAALPYFEQLQNEDGGFPWQKPSDFGTDTDANSTAVVLQALNALEEPDADWAIEDNTPTTALLALWDAETGGYNWQLAMPGANVLATAQAVQALTGLNLVAVPHLAATATPLPAILPEAGTTGLNRLFLVAGATLLISGLLLHRRSA